ncbi:MAG: TonB-dependent receptor [Candidatus Omnitrophica bacterium]|nr:TonB-dependent receptor [Candidatus Omnitrophota bacterium]
MKVFLSIFSFLIFSFNLCLADNSYRAGENQQEGTIRLKEIVVTPYKVAIGSFQSPASVDEILVKEADLKGVSGLADSLKNIPSVSYSITGGLGGTSGISIRGAETRHTQLMYDEIKLYDPIVTASYFYAYNYMSLDNLERIEVAKGPYSSLYGSDSIGGTIRLLPRKGKGKPTVSFTQEIGSYQTYREKLSFQGEADKLNYSLAISRKDVNDFYAGKYKDGNHETDPFSNLNAALRLDYSLSDNLEVGLISDYTYAKYDYDDSSPVVDANNYARFYQGVSGLNLEHQISDVFLQKITFGYTRTHRKDYPESGDVRWYDGNTYQAKWQADLDIIPENKIIFGFDYLRERGESIYTSRQTANTKGYYIENLFNPWKNLLFSASYRREEHSQFGSENIVSFSGSYFIDETGTKLKSSFGQGFKVPSIYQLYDSFSGNSDLTPERSRSFEVGIEQYIRKNLKFGTTYFQTNIKNLIEYDYGAWKYKNVGKARIWGLENFLKYNFDDNTHLNLSYTYMDTEDKSDGSRLLRRPNNKVTLGFDTLINKLKISSDLSYVGNRIDYPGTVKLKSYILGNLSFNYQVNDNLNTFLRFENILDDDYELVEGYQTPEFSWYLGAKYTF